MPTAVATPRSPARRLRAAALAALVLAGLGAAACFDEGDGDVAQEESAANDGAGSDLIDGEGQKACLTELDSEGTCSCTGACPASASRAGAACR